MEHEVMKVFETAQLPNAQKGIARRAGLNLCRGNILTMKELYDLCESEPEKLLGIRNIGAKTAALILEVCAEYKRNGHE